jgi:5'-nucleotidase
MRQPSIALDLDGVIADFHYVLADEYNRRFSPSVLLTVADFDSGLESLGQPIYPRLIDIFNEPGFFDKLGLLPNSLEVASQFMDQGYEVRICTAPARDIKGVINGQSSAEKFDWVQKNMPYWGNDLIVTKHKNSVRADLLIDDYPPNIVNWCESNPEGIGYLVEQPWNKYFHHFPKNSVKNDLTNVIKLVDNLWCSDREKFVYRYDELSHWHSN